ncbi:MAG: DUF4198 domain-containing protein [Pseudomonadota bacterium]
MKAFLITLIACLVGAAPAWCHDFWVEPDAFVLDAPEPVIVSFLVGHGADRSAWPASQHRVVSFATISASGIEDQQAKLPLQAGGRDVEVQIEQAGAHYLTLVGTNAYSDLPAERFQAYATNEGIGPILSHRALAETEQLPGRELYSRRGKALIQVGVVTDEMEAFVTRPLGMTLEIVPLRHPSRVVAGETLPVEVRFRGARQAGVSLHLTDLGKRQSVGVVVTDEAGRAVIEHRAGAPMLAHAVWGTPEKGLLQDADYLTVFSSLTFEFPAG